MFREDNHQSYKQKTGDSECHQHKVTEFLTTWLPSAVGNKWSKENKLGQTHMEIFNCTNHAMTIEKGSLLGIIEKLGQEAQVGGL
jgi:hypothetical protein